MKYLVGEKFLNYLDAAERDADFRAEIPAFVAEIKKIFEPWQMAEYLEKARQTEPFDPPTTTRTKTPKTSRWSASGHPPVCCRLDAG